MEITFTHATWYLCEAYIIYVYVINNKSQKEQKKVMFLFLLFAYISVTCFFRQVYVYVSAGLALVCTLFWCEEDSQNLANIFTLRKISDASNCMRGQEN